jgi:hypothetical protein
VNAASQTLIAAMANMAAAMIGTTNKGKTSNVTTSSALGLRSWRMTAITSTKASHITT